VLAFITSVFLFQDAFLKLFIFLGSIIGLSYLCLCCILGGCRVIVLDHHKTALERLGNEASLGENVVKVIDMERSGATIAFDYFKDKIFSPDVAVKHPSILEEFERVRKLFLYIEDGDLWRWRLPNSKAFRSGLKDLDIEFDARKNPSLFDQVIACSLCLTVFFQPFCFILEFDWNTLAM